MMADKSARVAFPQASFSGEASRESCGRKDSPRNLSSENVAPQFENTGLPCSRVILGVAEMVAAQKFNEAHQQWLPTIYGSVSSGTQWRFLKLEGKTVMIDLADYPLPPVEQILGFLVWMVQEG